MVCKRILTYTDGLIEQWGMVKKGSDLTPSSSWKSSISLPINYSNAMYNVTVTASTENSPVDTGGEEIGVFRYVDNIDVGLHIGY